MISRQEWDAFCTERNNETEIGKWILCESREDGATRLFIHEFDSWISAMRKNGWWDTFTITDVPCKKGFYICEIKKFRIDRNGFMNAIVFPKKYLGETVDEDSAAWDYFFGTDHFSNEYRGKSQFRHRFNTVYLESLFRDEIEQAYAWEKEKEKMGLGYNIGRYTLSREIIMAKFMNDELTLEEIDAALNEPTDMEKLSTDIYRNPRKYETDYPLLMKKLPNEEVFGFPTPESIEGFLYRKDLEYDKLKLGDETNMLKRAEAVIRYWVDFHKTEKEAKKAKRKAEKAMKKAV